jgi:hypothetical protein
MTDKTKFLFSSIFGALTIIVFTSITNAIGGPKTNTIPLVDNYDTIVMSCSDDSSKIYYLQIINSNGMEIIEEWNEHYIPGYFNIEKTFTCSVQEYQEKWYYENYCLKKISYWILLEVDSTTNCRTYGWRGNQRFRKCEYTSKQ